MLQLLRNALGDRCIEQRQVHGDVGIFVNDIHKHIANRKRDGKFFPALADECLFFCLALYAGR